MSKPFESISLVVLDGVGCGPAKDTSEDYPEDTDCNSFQNAAREAAIGGTLFDSPALQAMGLKRIDNLGEAPVAHNYDVQGAFGSLEPTFAGNGSPEGHQSLAGLVTAEPYLLFNKTGIPENIVTEVEDVVAKIIGRPVKVIRYPGTDDINGIKFIQHPDIGLSHYNSKDTASGPLLLPIYASSDSLIQIAIHQDVLDQATIERIGQAVRSMLDDNNFRVCRVIMRPFTGEPGKFTRVSADRRDYAMNPDGPTLIDHLTEAGIPVFGIGKTPSMFNGQGFPQGRSAKLHDDDEKVKETLARIKRGEPGLTFTNLVGTDELYGHTRKPVDYIQHLMRMGGVLGEILTAMKDDQLLVVTSDHGNDPTQRLHTNHTRERVPILAAGPRIKRPVELGIRDTYADVAATLAENFGVQNKIPVGQSFLRELVR